jgi:transcriptional regulator with PAS, ATPase and Fis domain
MKNIKFMQVRDPSGETRVLKLDSFPIQLGTFPGNAEGLRDPQLSANAMVIQECEGGGLILKAVQEGLMFEVGDLRFPALQIPFAVPVKMGDSEVVFHHQDPRKNPILDPVIAQSKWYTKSEVGIRMLTDLRKSSATKLSVYLHGQTGTGKELLARQIHEWSDRASGPYITINCGALPVSLAESELFGHVKGAFTGACRDRPGALLQAHHGTLFLDEVGDLPAELQVKLLRFLESGEIRPVGSDRVVHADVRVVSATHKPLDKLVNEGIFRQDLYFRLASIPLDIPSLNSRPEDIRALSVKFATEGGKVLSENALDRLVSHQWAGNVRELRHAIERACGLAGPFEEVLHGESFAFLVHGGDGLVVAQTVIKGLCTLEEMEKVMLLRALKLTNGNRTTAAKVLGIARSTLFDMMKRHRVVGPRSAEYRLTEVAV